MGYSNQPRILLVEDEFFSQIIFKKVIENFRFCFDIAETAEKALEYTRNHEYKIIFVDLGLPDILGVELVKALREQLKLKTPLVAVTAFSSEKIKHECYASGFDYFIEKPFNEEKCLEVFQKFLISSAVLA